MMNLVIFETLLVESNNICNYQRNIQTLMTDAYKIQNSLAPPIMEIMLERKSFPHNLRNSKEFLTQRNRTVNYGLESLSNRLPQVWALFPDEYKQINPSDQFESNLRNCICTNCPCILCKRVFCEMFIYLLLALVIKSIV